MAELLEPQTREEQFLRAAATGDTSQMPTPITRIEMFLAYIAENGGGGGGGGGSESTIAWRPSVSADGTISWTRTSSTTTPTPVNVKGEKGEKGEKGDTGATGEKGETGADGAKGDKGDDGYSPTITVTEITGGHRVTVTDASGSDSFDVMDGQGGGGTSDFNDLTNRPKYLGDAMTNKTDVKGFELIEDHDGCYWYDDAYTWMGAWKKTPSGGATGHGMVVSRGQREIGLIKGDAGSSSSQRWRIPMADKVEDMLAEKADKATTYTKVETDGKIAEAMTDVDNEHFHPVTVLPNPADEDPTKRPKENHEYILIEYEQDGTTIKSETHYLFYGGAYHQKPTGGISLDGYATEQHVADAFAQHVKTDVPVNAVFTDTVYDDTALAARVTEVEGNHIELTQAQYTALPEEEKNNGKVYFITDGGAYVPAVDLIPHATQEPIVVGKFDLRGDGEYRNVYRIRRWIGDLKNASTIITAGWPETGVYIRPLRVFGSFTLHKTISGEECIWQYPIPYAEVGYDGAIGFSLNFHVNHQNKLIMDIPFKQNVFHQDDFAQVIIDYIETPIT